jgi:hypothetical protein
MNKLNKTTNPMKKHIPTPITNPGIKPNCPEIITNINMTKAKINKKTIPFSTRLKRL